MRTPLLPGSLVALAGLLAACGSGGSATQAPTATTAAPTPAPAATEPATGSSVPVTLADTSLGSVLTGADGMTLYVFVPDGGGESTCYDACAQNWPPLLGSVTPGSGLDAGDFGTTTRKDGAAQVTFYGWPLYYFAGDKAAK
jgi:predicted lipoprotein with Yx(FWY)xxD motif